MTKLIGVLGFALLALRVAVGSAAGDDTVISSQAATAAQTQAFQANAAKLGWWLDLKAKLVIANNLVCQGKFKKPAGLGGGISLAKTFNRNNGQTTSGIILADSYLQQSASTQVLIVYQELRRVCFSSRRQPEPAGGLGAANNGCADVLKKAQTMTNSAIDAAQDAENRASADGMATPEGLDNDEFQTELQAYCQDAKAALAAAKDKKKLYKMAVTALKQLDVGTPPANPSAEQSYLIDGYSRMCRAIDLADAAIKKAGK
ncbi:MAG: hypothetical protein ACYTEG_02005 [Planctomycetota bacterium]|jgi:hypothetical protein